LKQIHSVEQQKAACCESVSWASYITTLLMRDNGPFFAHKF